MSTCVFNYVYNKIYLKNYKIFIKYFNKSIDKCEKLLYNIHNKKRNGGFKDVTKTIQDFD